MTAATPSVRLADCGFEAELSPAHGALLMSLAWRGPSGRSHALLHRPADAAAEGGAPRRFGCWPMVPFANRAFGGRVSDGTIDFGLPINDPGMGATIHGFGWQAEWQVTECSAGALTMRHERPAEQDPYAYRAEMSLMLGDRAARLELSVVNLADTPLPFGLGLHPWFPAAADTRLTARGARRLVLGPGFRATGSEPLEGGGPFAKGGLVRGNAELVLNYLGWAGEAVLSAPSRGLEIVIAASDSLRHPLLWAPPGADFVCFEPQSHALGAPSEPAARAAAPLCRLAPGEALTGWMTLAPREIEAG